MGASPIPVRGAWLELFGKQYYTYAIDVVESQISERKSTHKVINHNESTNRKPSAWLLNDITDGLISLVVEHMRGARLITASEQESEQIVDPSKLVGIFGVNGLGSSFFLSIDLSLVFYKCSSMVINWMLSIQPRYLFA